MLYIANSLSWESNARWQAAWRSSDDNSHLLTAFSFGAAHELQAPSGAADELFCTELLCRQEVLHWLGKSPRISLVTNEGWAHFLSSLFETEIERADPQQPSFRLTREDFVLRVQRCGGQDIRSINDPIFQHLGTPDELENRGEIRFYLHFIRPMSQG